MASAFETFVTLIVTTFQSLTAGMGNGVSQYIENLFLTTSSSGTTSLSAFGICIAVFAGIAAGFAIVRFLFRWISSMGN